MTGQPHETHIKPTESPVVNNSIGEDLDELDLTCPGCAADLTGDRVFQTWGVCPSCRRHFWITGRERLLLLLDRESFRETNGELLSLEPLVFRDKSPSAESSPGGALGGSLGNAVVTGVGRVGGRDAVIIVIDFAHLGNAIGVIAGEKIALALELAISRRLPVLAICSAGSARTPESALSLLQSTKIASLVTRLRRASVPFVSILTHPTTGSVYSGFANFADFVFAEPGALISASSHRESPTQMRSFHAEQMMQTGVIDDIVDRTHLRDQMIALLDILESRGVPRAVSSPSASISPVLRSAEIAEIAFDPRRPRPQDYLQALMPVFLEFHGDRVAGDDASVVTGFGQIDGVSMAAIALNPSRSGERAFSSVGPSGFRKAVRLAKLAVRFDLPLLVLIDARETDRSEDDFAGLGAAQSQLMNALTAAPVPIIAVITGTSAGATGIAFSTSDRLLMQEHAVLETVGIASQIDRDKVHPASTVILSSRDCERLGMVHQIIPEPVGGAQADLGSATLQLRLAILHQLSTLNNLGTRRMLEERARHSRSLGISTPEGTEAARLEIAQLQDIQKTLERSFGDLRSRLDQRSVNLPGRPQLPNVGGLPQLASLHRPIVSRLELTGIADRLAATGREFADRMTEAASRNASSNDANQVPGDDS